MRHTTRRSLLKSTLVMAALAASSPAAKATPPATPESETQQVLRLASERLAAVETVRFTLDVEGHTWIDEGRTIRLLAARGEMARPDRVAVEFRVNILNAADVTIRMVTLGEESWTTDLLTGEWGDAPPEFGYNPSVLYDNQHGLGPVMGRLDTAGITGQEEIEGRDAWHITGTSSAAVIEMLTAGTMTGEPIEIDLWIDTETYDILQVRVVEPPSESNEHPATWLLRLSGFDDEVTIEPPI